jgi:hypothetical protein
MTGREQPEIRQDSRTGRWYSLSGLFLYTGYRDTREEVVADLHALGWTEVE